MEPVPRPPPTNRNGADSNGADGASNSTAQPVGGGTGRGRGRGRGGRAGAGSRGGRTGAGGRGGRAPAGAGRGRGRGGGRGRGRSQGTAAAEGVAGPEELLGEEEGEEESQEEDDTDMLAATALAMIAAGQTDQPAEGQQQQGRTLRPRRQLGQQQEISMEDYVLDADLEHDQQRVGQLRGESAAAAGEAGETARGQAGQTAAGEAAGTTTASCIKRKRVCL